MTAREDAAMLPEITGTLNQQPTAAPLHFTAAEYFAAADCSGVEISIGVPAGAAVAAAGCWGTTGRVLPAPSNASTGSVLPPPSKVSTGSVPQPLHQPRNVS